MTTVGLGVDTIVAQAHCFLIARASETRNVSSSFNRITLVGNLTRDPEIKYVASGSAVTKFSLAVNSHGQNAETMYVDCVAWEKLAETCNLYLKRGMSVLVDGRLSIRSYETKEGEKRKATQVVVNLMQMLARKPDDAEAAGLASAGDSTVQRRAAPAAGGGAAVAERTEITAADIDELLHDL
jgi:single-strand DNA-binding protein